MEIDTFREMVEKSGSIVFFGGAGGVYGKRNSGFQEQHRNLWTKDQVFLSAGGYAQP